MFFNSWSSEICIEIVPYKRGNKSKYFKISTLIVVTIARHVDFCGKPDPRILFVGRIGVVVEGGVEQFLPKV